METTEERSRASGLLELSTAPKVLSKHENSSLTYGIAAARVGGGSWGLMDILGSATVFCGKDTQEGIKLGVCNTGHITTGAKRLIRAVARGVDAGQYPTAALEGMGGTYFFKGANGSNLAIFKPCNEEPLGPCNPKGFVGRCLGDPGWKATVRVGEGALREVAACLLDKDGFANVPTTVLCRVSHPAFHNPHIPQIPRSDGTSAESLSSSSPDAPDVSSLDPNAISPFQLKMGSMQQFVEHIGDTTEMGASRFSCRDVHKIGILDIRLYNTDRHAGNMLVQKRQPESSRDEVGRPSLIGTGYDLVPIDHGFCLPEALEPPYFEWLHWPQARLPFDEEELEYIKNLDIEADKQLLRRELPVLREECLRTLEVSTLLLKICAKHGLSLHEIGEIMSQPIGDLENNDSELEKLCLHTLETLDGLDTADVGCDGGYGFDPDSPLIGDDLQFSFDDARDLEFQQQGWLSKTNSSCRWSSPCLNLLPADSLDSVQSPKTLKAIKSTAKPVAVETVKKLKLNRLRTAQSMADPGGFFARPNPQGKLPQEALTSPRRIRTSVLFPRPVNGVALSSKSSMFRDLDEKDWTIFVSMFQDHVTQVLLSRQREGVSIGTIKKPGGVAALGFSCPKF